MSKREEKVRKRSEEIVLDNKKSKKSNQNFMEGSKSVYTETSLPVVEIPHPSIREEAKQMMANMNRANIENIIAESMAKQMELWQGKILDTFITKCNLLVEAATIKTDEKINVIVEKTVNLDKRVRARNNGGRI